MLITFEGSEGTGKSIQSHKLYEMLNNNRSSLGKFSGDNIAWRKAPGGTEIGDKLRDILLDPDLFSDSSSTISPQTELYMFLADRSQLVHELRKHEKEHGGTIFILDRYYASTYAYQSARENDNVDKILDRNNILACDGMIPDLTFYLWASPEVGLARKAKQGEITRFENEELKYHQKVDKYFKEFFKHSDPEKVVFINTEELDEDQVANKILEETIIRLSNKCL